MPRIFVTGAAGYVGGDFVALAREKHPDYEITALVRSEAQKKALEDLFPNIQCVTAPSQPHDFLVAAGGAADVVLQIANSDDADLSHALLNGVAQKPGATYIHVSGIATLIDPLIPLGQVDTRVYDDATQTQEMISLPHDRLHTAIEQSLVRRAGELEASLAIVSLPRMHGKSSGLVPQSKIIEPYLRGVLENGKAFTVGEGRSITSFAHVRDATSALLLVTEEALKGGGTSKPRWDTDDYGYYFVETGESSFVDEAKETARLMHSRGLLASSEVEILDEASASKFWDIGPKFWGSNSRCKASKLRGLGWRPDGSLPSQTLDATLDYYFGGSRQP